MKALDIRLFYLIASILMVISIIGAIWGLWANWGHLNGGNKISSVSSLFFNFLLLALFGSLYFSSPKPLKIVDNPEIDALLNKYKKQDKKSYAQEYIG